MWADDDNGEYRKFNIEKLKTYFEIVIDIRTRKREDDGSMSDKHIYVPFEQCSIEDFNKVKFIPKDEDEFKKEVGKLICPKFDGLEEFFKVNGRYTDMKHRQSFSVEIYLCNSRYKDNCK